MPGKPQEDAQSGMFDREVEDPDLEEACFALLDEDVLEKVRVWKQATQTKKDRLAFHGLKDTERLRIGLYVIEGHLYTGGGENTEPPKAWSSVGGSPKLLSDA